MSDLTLTRTHSQLNGHSISYDLLNHMFLRNLSIKEILRLEVTSKLMKEKINWHQLYNDYFVAENNNADYSDKVDYKKQFMKASLLLFRSANKAHKKGKDSYQNFLLQLKPRLVNDLWFMHCLVEKYPETIIYVKWLRNNKISAMSAIIQRGNLYEILSEDMKADPDIVKNAIETSSKVYSKLPESYKRNDEIIRKTLKKNGLMIIGMSDEIKDNEEYMTIAIQSRNGMWKHASDRLKQTSKIVISAALKGYSRYHLQILRNMALDLCCDRTFMISLIEYQYRAISFCHEDLINDKEFILQAAKVNSEVFKIINLDDFSDDFQHRCILANYSAIKYVGDDFKKRHIKLQKNIAKEQPHLLVFLSEEIITDKKFIFELADDDNGMRNISFRYVTDSNLEVYEKILLILIEKNYRYIFDSPMIIRRDINFIIAAVRVNPVVIKHLSSYEFNDEIKQQLIFENPEILKHVDDGFKTRNIMFVKKVIRSNPQLIFHAIKQLEDEEAFILLMTKNHFKFMLRHFGCYMKITEDNLSHLKFIYNFRKGIVKLILRGELDYTDLFPEYGLLIFNNKILIHDALIYLILLKNDPDLLTANQHNPSLGVIQNKYKDIAQIADPNQRQIRIDSEILRIERLMRFMKAAQGSRNRGRFPGFFCEDILREPTDEPTHGSNYTI